MATQKLVKMVREGKTPGGRDYYSERTRTPSGVSKFTEVLTPGRTGVGYKKTTRPGQKPYKQKVDTYGNDYVEVQHGHKPVGANKSTVIKTERAGKTPGGRDYHAIRTRHPGGGVFKYTEVTPPGGMHGAGYRKMTKPGQKPFVLKSNANQDNARKVSNGPVKAVRKK